MGKFGLVVMYYLLYSDRKANDYAFSNVRENSILKKPRIYLSTYFLNIFHNRVVEYTEKL